MKLIIVEGARGVGKTTFVQELRNKIPQTMVMQLTGIEKTDYEHAHIYDHYTNLMDYIEKEKYIPYNLVLDRFFFSECVMAELYKNYSFICSAKALSTQLAKSGIEVVLLLLTLEDNIVDGTAEEQFEERLVRPDKVEFQNIAYEAKSSVKEQELYKKIVDKFEEDYKDFPDIKVLKVINRDCFDFESNVNKVIEALK